MVSAYSLDGVLTVGLLLICTCAYMRRVTKLRNWLFSENKGFWGILYKAAVIGIRLHILVSLSCFSMACYVLLFR
ncbi:unnamed protein product [Hydatigera taeniaeformis]|uniref:Protein kish n=1 Tax=Hydatigena taeniaeformis TaxID=6205 RepID=A0A0R3X0K5_HYDTA|nr:unnamed protein product [Hydatigera taeniaeformis]